jgi:hypothetical protein
MTAFVKNLNTHTVYVNWNASVMPTGISLKMYWSGSSLNPPPDNTYVEWVYDTHRETLSAGAVRGIRFELSIGSSAAEGSFAYTQYFAGFDTET